MAERQSRRELLEVIEQQKEQLARYETRLKDVVRAYKGLSKENEALKTSLKAITEATEEPSTKEGSSVEGDVSDVESLADSQASADTANFKSRLGALSASLASISQEKAQNENKFISERRKFKKEKEELVAQVHQLKSSEESLRASVEETKSKLIVEKHEREQETNNNHLMMKELQKLVSDERNLKEKLNEDLHQQKSQASALQTEQIQNVETEKLKDMETELEDLRQQLGSSEAKLKDQDTTRQQLRQLQQELFEVRQQHQEQLRVAEVAREAAELRAMDIQKQQEIRVGNLELSLQELSASLADYQRLRETDQTDINRMRIKIDSLSDENSVLAQTQSGETEEAKEEHNEITDDQKLIEKVKSYKQILLERGLEPELMENLFSLAVHSNLRNQVEDLKKALASAEKTQKQSSPNLYEDFLASSAQTAQLENLKAQNEILKTKLSELRSQICSLEEDCTDKEARILEQREQASVDKEIIRMENRKQIGMLKFELQQQRERSLALLEEKDGEIQRLMVEVEARVEEAFFSPERATSASPLVLPTRKVSCDISDMNSGQSSSGAPLHYVQELSRKEVEMKELRSMNFKTETTLRELQLNMSAKEERYQERIEELEDTIARLERMTTSEGANLEYLKNVVLTYMLSTDIASRNHMLKAIGAVLKLTKSEVSRVVEHNHAWWWQQNKQQPTPARKNSRH